MGKIKNKLFKINRSLLGLIFIVTFIIFSFQNCNKLKFEVEPYTVDQLSAEVPSIMINHGASYAKEAAVMLQLTCLRAEKMYITSDSTCESGGEWEEFKSERGWILDRENQSVSVYAKFDRISIDGEQVITDCINASIIHDSIPPTVEYLLTPSDKSSEEYAEFEFAANDELSGVEEIFCEMNGEKIKDCGLKQFLDALAEGTHSFSIHAIDRAGNLSESLDYNWLVDLTDPIVALLDPKPDLITADNSAQFQFRASDELSGIKSVYCQLNDLQEELCSGSISYSNLGEGLHTFRVWAEDKVGRFSESEDYTWTVDSVASGAFSVTGITGVNDAKTDQYLTGGLVPQVNWSQSSRAVKYVVSILNANGTKSVCDEVETKNLKHQFASSCNLENGTEYAAQVKSFTITNQMTEAKLFKFLVDTAAPVIAINTPVSISKDHKSVVISFNVKDAESGIKSSDCFLKTPSQTIERQCKDLVSITYNDLKPGEYSFWIQAVDNAGNPKKSTEVKFELLNLEWQDHSLLVKDHTTKLDILFIIDNSGSMNEERKELGQKLSDLTDRLGDLDWRICLTSTSPANDGQLRSFGTTSLFGGNDGTYFIDKTTPDFKTKFLNLATGNIGNTSGDEQGIYATVRAVERNDSRCFRQEAGLAVVLISDEDERSVGGFLDSKSSNQYKKLTSKNWPATAVSTVRSVFGENKIFSFHSIVIQYNDSACLSVSKGAYGRRYQELSALTDGIDASICAPNYGPILEDMADRIKIHLGSHDLRCAPVGEVKVDINSSPALKNWTLDGNKVNFNPALGDGTNVRFRYYCEK